MPLSSASPPVKKQKSKARRLCSFAEGSIIFRCYAQSAAEGILNRFYLAASNSASDVYKRQEDSRSAQILCLAPAACGGLGNDELVEGMTAAVGLDPVSYTHLALPSFTWAKV